MYSTGAMGRMVRKQLYIDVEHEKKLKRLAKKWKVTEAAVVRRALEELPEAARTPEDEAMAHLVARGLVKRVPKRRLTQEQLDAMDREIDEIWAKYPEGPPD